MDEKIDLRVIRALCMIGNPSCDLDELVPDNCNVSQRDILNGSRVLQKIKHSSSLYKQAKEERGYEGYGSMDTRLPMPSSTLFKKERNSLIDNIDEHLLGRVVHKRLTTIGGSFGSKIIYREVDDDEEKLRDNLPFESIKEFRENIWKKMVDYKYISDDDLSRIEGGIKDTDKIKVIFVPKKENGDLPHSPGFNSLWVVTRSEKFHFGIMWGADASSIVSENFWPLFKPGERFPVPAGFVFSPLSKINYIYSPMFIPGKEEKGDSLDIKVFDDKMDKHLLSVVINWGQATEEEVIDHYNYKTPDFVFGVIKGLLMYEYVRAQFPDKSPKEIFTLIDQTESFVDIADLIIGTLFELSTQIDLGLWIQKPKSLSKEDKSCCFTVFSFFSFLISSCLSCFNKEKEE